jgi:hypothetical protein
MSVVLNRRSTMLGGSDPLNPFPDPPLIPLDYFPPSPHHLSPKTLGSSLPYALLPLGDPA